MNYEVIDVLDYIIQNIIKKIQTDEK